MFLCLVFLSVGWKNKHDILIERNFKFGLHDMTDKLLFKITFFSVILLFNYYFKKSMILFPFWKKNPL